MSAYWLLYLLPSLRLVLPQQTDRRLGTMGLVLFFVFAAALVGLRHEVGGDWGSYVLHVELIRGMSLTEVPRGSDPGYHMLNWLLSGFGTNAIYLINSVCAIVAVGGVVIFARQQPLPWLALAVAVPYLLVVVAMGYTRQSVALGFELLGLAALARGYVLRFLFFVLLGAAFHKSAVLLLPIAMLAAQRHRVRVIVWVTICMGVSTQLLLVEHAQALWANYVESKMESEGGFIRVMLNALPALLFLMFGRRMADDETQLSLWRWLSVFALLCLPLVGYASTAVDRVALYLIPLQIYVMPRLPRLASSPDARMLIAIGVVGYYAAVLYVWLKYAVHAIHWLPYQWAPLVGVG